jgi:tRNA (guanine37-N1)-methyltransferase
MRFEIVTIFPGFFAGIFENGILRRALTEGLVEVGVHDLRTFTHDRHRTVDDRPFGGGEGMVLKPEPLAEALASLGIPAKAERALGKAAARTRVILLSAQGRPFNQAMAHQPDLLRHGAVDRRLRAERRRAGRRGGGGCRHAPRAGSAGQRGFQRV